MTVTKVKERRKRKSEEMERRREKSNGCTLSFIMATLDAKGQFGDNVIKNPATYIYMYMYTGKKWEKKNDWARKVIPAVMQRKLIHLYDKQFHVVWQDIRAPSEKNPDCHMTGTWTKLQLVQEIWSLFFTLYSLFESHIKMALSLLLTFG